MKRILILLFAFGSVSCQNYSPEIRQTLDLADGNKEELIKVLQHYQKINHKEKLLAAEFLIANLPYNFSYDTSNLEKYRIIPDLAKSQREKFDSIDVPALETLWNKVYSRTPPLENIYSKPIMEDIKLISSDFLIKNIEDAYSSWKNNPYTKDSVPFEDFCEYVLPYRQIQGKAIEDWREFFSKNNINHFQNSYPIPFVEACDSLFAQYKEYSFNYELTEGLPILKFRDFMKLKNGKCTVKSWFNTYIVNAEGIPMVVDFVPAWGHREDDHQWNALKYGGKTLYFESYWEKGHSWFYNDSINSNHFHDDWAGNIRLPKIYRHTFSTHIEGPISDNKVKIENIPPLFRNIKKKDVSEEYFKTEDVKLDIKTGLPKNKRYAYLAVLGVNKEWIPVQWGKIEDNKVTFNKMGTDIVYQPVFYTNGVSVPFGSPFHLDHQGNMREFIPADSSHNILVKRKYWPKKGLLKDAELIRGSLIQGSNHPEFKNAVTLGTIDFIPELRPYTINIKSENAYRYYRIISKNKITIKQIELFFENKSGKETKINGRFISNVQSAEKDSLTWKGIDLGTPQTVSTIEFAPPNNLNHVLKGNTYELYYIDDGTFISLGRKKADEYHLLYENVPKNALLYLQCLDEGRQERIFEYREGEQIWY